MRRTRLISVAFAVSAFYLVLYSCQSEEAIRKAQYTANGHKLYTEKCQNCHGAKGEGLGQLYPPLNDSAYLRQHREQLACIVRYGLSGPIEVDGREFNTPMPANPRLTPIEIAYILTYIGNAFGGEEGLYTQEAVQQSLQTCMEYNF